MAIPLITLLRSPNAFYLYDTNRNEIVDINESVYSALAEFLSTGHSPNDTDVNKKIDALRKQGYLSEHRAQEIIHPYTTYLPFLLDRSISQLTLQLTQNCNFRCKYCSYTSPCNQKQRAHSAKRMSWDTAKAAIDFLWEHSVDSPRISIGFYGGEPLLEFGLMQEVTQYAEERFQGKEIMFAMTTNASLFTDEIISFLEEHNVSATLSLDGPKEIHDKHRVFAKDGTGTFDSVIERITYISEKYPDFAQKLQINMVIDPTNDFDYVNSLPIFLEPLHCGGIRGSLVDTTYNGWIDESNERYVSKLLYQIFLVFLSYLGRFPASKTSKIAHQDLLSVAQVMDHLIPVCHLPLRYAPGGPCIPGQMRPLVDVNGNIFPCERVGEESEVMCIGNIREGFNYEKASALLNVAKITEDMCKNCWASRFCTQCAKLADGGTNLSPELRKKHCIQTRNAVHHTLEKIILLREIPSYYL